LLFPSDYRQAYGSVFILEIPDGTIIPWVPLSIKDYFHYVRAIEQNSIAPAILENEIFTKCVKDEVLVENIDKQKAGTVSSVADIILKNSAPQTAEEFEYLLNIGRENVNNIIHQAISLITQAFPAYTPDDIYAMDIFTLIDRLALSERKLMEAGVLKEPIELMGDSKQRRRKKPKVDLSKLKQEFEEQEEPREWNTKKRQAAGEKLNQTYVEEEATPDFGAKTDEDGNTVISLNELAYNLDNDVMAESLEEKQMVEDAKRMYGEYLEKLREGKKVKIKPQDERIKEAEKRMEENRRKLKEQLKKK
jgi:hypothetical protein